MIKYIEEENSPASSALTDHFNILTKCFVIIRSIDGGTGVAFNIVIKRYFFIANQLFKIIPVPFSIGRPIMRKVFNNDRRVFFVKLFSKGFRVKDIKSGDRF